MCFAITLWKEIAIDRHQNPNVGHNVWSYIICKHYLHQQYSYGRKKIFGGGRLYCIPLLLSEIKNPRTFLNKDIIISIRLSFEQNENGCFILHASVHYSKSNQSRCNIAKQKCEGYICGHNLYKSGSEQYCRKWKVIPAHARVNNIA